MFVIMIDKDARVCYEPHPFEIKKCLMACDSINETEWSVEFIDWRYDANYLASIFTYKVEVSDMPGNCTMETHAQMLTSTYLLHSGCCDVDIHDHTLGVRTSKNFEYLKGGWLIETSLKAGEEGIFELYINGNVEPAWGSVCVRGGQMRCSCDLIQAPDLCNAS